VTTLDRAKRGERLGIRPHGVVVELQDGLRAARDLD
jgi:hypothetical protein